MVRLEINARRLAGMRRTSMGHSVEHMLIFKPSRISMLAFAASKDASSLLAGP